MKQKLTIEVEETELQKALHKQIKALTKHELRDLVKELITENAQKEIDAKTTDVNIEDIVKKYVHRTIERQFTGVNSIARKTEDLLDRKVNDIVRDGLVSTLHSAIVERYEFTVRSIIRDLTSQAIKELIEKEVKEQISETIKAIIADKLLK